MILFYKNNMKEKIYIKKIEGQEVKMIHREFKTQFKIVEETDDKWIVEGYASIFGNVDSYGEIVDKGAFQKWLDQFPPDASTGVRRFPKFVRGHDWSRPLGPTIYCEEDEIGLKVRGELLKEIQDAREEYALIKSGASTDLSFGFSVRGDEIIDGFRHLKEIQIYEWSPVLVGANPKAMITDVKADGQDEKAAGDACEMEDGTPGEMQDDGEGNLVCMPKNDGKSKKENDEAAGGDPAPENGGEPSGSAAGGDAGQDGNDEPGGGDAPAPGGNDGDEKAGRVLSSKNRSLIESAVEGMKNCTDALEALLKATEDDDSGKSADTSKVDQREGKGSGDEKTLIRGILRDARKADKIFEKIILKAKNY